MMDGADIHIDRAADAADVLFEAPPETPVDLNQGWVAAPDLAELDRHMRELGRERRPDLTDDVYVMPVENYLDDARLEAEKKHIFMKTPLMVAMAAELKAPGDFKTMDLCGVPLLLVRGNDGTVRAFHNACRHRGTAVVQEPDGSGLKRMVCPWHAWTYDLNGELIALPFKEGFPCVQTRSGEGLKPIPAVEKYGVIFVRLDGEAFDLDDHFAGLGDHIKAFGWDEFEVAEVRGRTLTTPVNWKLLFDTFCENYHLGPLHGEVLPGALSNVAAYDRFGPHIRETFANLAVLKPDSPSNLAFNMVYLIYPNLVMLPAPHSGMVFIVLPGSHAGEAVLMNLYVYRKNMDPNLRAIIEAGYEYSWKDIVIPQDIPVTQRAMTAMKAGSISELIFGRNEGALHHFHGLHQQRVDAGKQLETSAAG